MKLLDEYFDLQDKIFELFNYDFDWHIYPIDDLTDRYWTIRDKELWYADKKECLEKLISANFEQIDSKLMGFTWKSLILEAPKVSLDNHWTLIPTDMQEDDNKFISILDNTKKV